MKKQKIDIDTMFSQFREEAKPTPLQNLIEARPSGALFALKTSLSTSLSSVKMWIGIACLSALATTGILYTVREATEQQDHSTAVEQIRLATTAEHSDMRIGSEVENSAPEQMQHAMAAKSSGGNTMAAPSRFTTVNKTTANTHAKENIRATEYGNRLDREQEAAAVRATTDDIVTAHYREAASNSSMEYDASAPSSFALPEEPFPFPDMLNNSRPREASLMINGLPLLADIVQLQGEFQISEGLSYGVLLGVGNVQGQTADTSHLLLLAGAQFNYYLLGDFEEGLQIGAQALYSSTNIRAHNTFLYENGRVLSLTPYAGYKLVLASGLTMNVQAGVGASTPIFIPTGQSSENNTEYKWHVSTRMHLNIGWSL